MSRKLASKFYVNDLKDDIYQDKTKTLLLVVDEQPKLMTTMENGERTTTNTLALIKAFKEYEMNYLATEQYPKGLGRSDERILAEISEEKIFAKSLFDAAIPEVVAFIKENGIKKVLVTGAEGHICIYQTVRSLLDMGLEVFLVEDAVASFTEDLKATALRSLENMGAVIVNTEMVLFDIARDAKDIHFKFISNLVKSLR
ncbi:isochorismatase family protein [uncultured Anaerococcus sp.]|uniref:isochorismatase family protein n=1 Tax=uncultured Anaerococcus sp. TaxID=293428 RepID=UPI00260AC237|nr:isochorismatase family protein [uncultured Anaerococcus sp.]